jgi:hypothetical protein
MSTYTRILHLLCHVEVKVRRGGCHPQQELRHLGPGLWLYPCAVVALAEASMPQFLSLWGAATNTYLTQKAIGKVTWGHIWEDTLNSDDYHRAGALLEWKETDFTGVPWNPVSRILSCLQVKLQNENTVADLKIAFAVSTPFPTQFISFFCAHLPLNISRTQVNIYSKGRNFQPIFSFTIGTQCKKNNSY